MLADNVLANRLFKHEFGSPLFCVALAQRILNLCEAESITMDFSNVIHEWCDMGDDL